MEEKYIFVHTQKDLEILRTTNGTKTTHQIKANINDVKNLGEKYSYSPIFDHYGQKLRLVYKITNYEKYGDVLSTYVQNCCREKFYCGVNVRIVRRGPEKKSGGKTFVHEFIEPNEVWGFHAVTRISTIENPANGFVDENLMFTISLEIESKERCLDVPNEPISETQVRSIERKVLQSETHAESEVEASPKNFYKAKHNDPNKHLL